MVIEIVVWLVWKIDGSHSFLLAGYETEEGAKAFASDTSREEKIQTIVTSLKVRE